MTEKNWAGNLTYAGTIHAAESIDHLQALVRQSRHVRALGSRHSFNTIADTPGDIISLARLDRIIALDADNRTVTIEGGVRYGQLGAHLQANGWALHNLASLPHISVAGACATATHGSGETNGSLATAVSAMDIVTATGDIISVSRATHAAHFSGMVVSLGALGIVARLTLDIVPTYDVQQDVYEHLSLAQLAEQFDAIQASAYSVSLFTDWRDEQFNQLWLKRRVPAHAWPDTLHNASRASDNRHPIPGISAESCTAQMGVAGAWCDRLPHFRMEFTPSSGEELQSEYFVPRAHGVDAIRAVMAMGDRIAPLLLVSEVRTIAADDLWLSPCYQQPCVALHFTWKQDWPAVRGLLPQLEAALAPFAARPHWGKLFTMPPERLKSLYARMPDFRRLLRDFDSGGKFRNRFLDEYVGDA